MFSFRFVGMRLLGFALLLATYAYRSLAQVNVTMKAMT